MFNDKFPAVGFGTYPLRGDGCYKAVTQAIEVGYRLIDTATFYQNFQPIGEAIKSIERENLYIISKVWHNSQTAKALRADFAATLKELQIAYLDAYLIHWPNSQVPIEETLGTMEEFRKEGYVRHLGVSNCTVNHLKRALELNIPITWNQVEMHPFFYDPELIEFCRQNQIGLQAWSPLGRGEIKEDALLKAIGEKHNKTASQVALRWIHQHHCIPLPGSQNKIHMQENLAIFDFALTKMEMDVIDTRARVGKRKRLTKEKNLGFNDEFDFAYKDCWSRR